MEVVIKYMGETNKLRMIVDETFKREAEMLLLQGGKIAKELARNIGGT